ncbi:hypothetical protein FRX31_012337 [Thalictrum thalictroides]|uniref:Uncharacterized protein n=1 Tax=Thalictrum thalictroides TaxID=46969 RepID=A0A7J6WL35_THATH|nr:hypothetical protein FRX31_025448 [Thalictrum thalictroides]KAF5198076.1 hypothetical protein FRX31_012337 [Thalictrum thalictroides]
MEKYYRKSLSHSSSPSRVSSASCIRKSRVIIRPRHRMSLSRFNAQPSHSTLPFGHYYMYEWERPGPRGTTTWKPGFPLSTNGLLTGPFP